MSEKMDQRELLEKELVEACKVEELPADVKARLEELKEARAQFEMMQSWRRDERLLNLIKAEAETNVETKFQKLKLIRGGKWNE